MKLPRTHLRTLALAACLTANAVAHAEAPRRNLLVQMRLLDAAAMAEDLAASPERHGFTAGTQNASAKPPTVQQLQVMNGSWGSVRFEQALPFEWVQALASRGAGSAASGASAVNAAGGSVVNAVTWLPAGQALAVRPQWPGGRQPVRLEIRVEAASVDERAGAGAVLPATREQAYRATLLVPLGQWTTAATGGSAAAPPARGQWSSAGAANHGSWALQVLVLVP